MLRNIKIKKGVNLSDYERYASLALSVQELKKEADIIVPKLRGITIWMINSTDKGGGVAEMLPRQISLLRQLGVDVRWLVLQTDNSVFFRVTKKIHNLIHGQGAPGIEEEGRAVYESVNEESARELLDHVKPGDIVVVHDPQPLPIIRYVKQQVNISAIWRCHIGYETSNEQTRSAWTFVKPYVEAYDHTIFSAPEYIPDFLSGKTSVIPPSIDPLSHKNRDLHVHKLTGILCNGGLLTEYHPILTPPFGGQVKRLSSEGAYELATEDLETGLLFSPVITQVSRWDRLKGFRPLLEGFIHLKRNIELYGDGNARHIKRLKLLKLILAGPEPAFVKDDPEAFEVLNDLSQYYLTLSPEVQEDIAMLVLPMQSTKENALIVNALQRCSTVVVQNSIREGFGLTATEAMWKILPVMTSNACGLRQQVRDHLDGRVVYDPENTEEIAVTLNEMLIDPKRREVMAYSAQKRVFENFLIFTDLRSWLKTLNTVSLHRQQTPVSNLVN